VTGRGRPRACPACGVPYQWLDGDDGCWSRSAPPTGFKFAPLVGRVLADQALHGGTEVDVSPFAADRPALTAAEPEVNYQV
jgi:hypothetical protein